MPFKDGELLPTVPSRFTPSVSLCSAPHANTSVLSWGHWRAPQTALMCSLAPWPEWHFCSCPPGLGVVSSAFLLQMGSSTSEGFASDQVPSCPRAKILMVGGYPDFHYEYIYFPIFFLSFGHFCRDLRSVKQVSSNHLGAEVWIFSLMTAFRMI